MRFRLALLLGAAFVIAGVVVMIPTDDGDVTADSTSTTAADTSTTSESGETTTTEGSGTTTTQDGGTATTAGAGETTTTVSGDTTTTTVGGTTTTTGQETTTTTTASGEDVTGPTITNVVISDDDLTEWCEGDPEENSTMTISLQAEDPSGIDGVFVSWLVDLSDGFADLVLNGDTWETEILFEAGTIFDIIEPQPIDMTIVAEDSEGNFTFVDRFGPTLSPQECG